MHSSLNYMKSLHLIDGLYIPVNSPMGCAGRGISNSDTLVLMRPWRAATLHNDGAESHSLIYRIIGSSIHLQSHSCTTFSSGLVLHSCCPHALIAAFAKRSSSHTFPFAIPTAASGCSIHNFYRLVFSYYHSCHLSSSHHL